MGCSVPACKNDPEEDYMMFGKRYRIDGKPVCRDCFFEQLGDVVEKNPIGLHMMATYPRGNKMPSE